MSRRRAMARANAPPGGKGTSLEPLLCAKCGAPQPVGDGDTVQCRGCGTTAPLPEPYKMLRDAHRLSESDAAQLDALCADIARPPAAWERVAVWVGYGVGIATLVILAVGALIGAIGGLVAGDKLGVGDTISKIFAGVGALICGFISVPFVGEWVVGYVTHIDVDAAMKAVSGARTLLGTDLVIAGLLYFLGVVPIAAAWRTSQNITKLTELQAKLAAQPASTPGGACSCRRCGAPLDFRPSALAARCLYCSADNLLTVTRTHAAQKKADATEINLEVRAAVDAHEETKRSDRRTMWLLLATGLLLAPVICAAGWLMHKLLVI